MVAVWQHFRAREALVEMARPADVAQAMVSLCAAALYPNGTGMPSIARNAAPVRVYRGWPVEARLIKDLAAGVANISVFPRNIGHANTVYDREPIEVTRTLPTVTLTVVGNVVTLGGIIAVPQNIFVEAVGGVAAGYPLQPADTLTTAATGLALALNQLFPGTTSVGPAITVAGPAGILSASAHTAGQVARELKRQDKSFQITTWAANPELRDSVSDIADRALAEPTFLSFPLGDVGWIRYDTDLEIDTAEEEGSYRHDLFYNVEYATYKVEDATEIGHFGRSVVGGVFVSTPAQP